MDATTRSGATPLRVKLTRSQRVWGAAPTSILYIFREEKYIKMSSGLPLELLAFPCASPKVAFSWDLSLSINTVGNNSITLTRMTMGVIYRPQTCLGWQISHTSKFRYIYSLNVKHFATHNRVLTNFALRLVRASKI